MTETRKLVAILAADVVGYSRLTATDEERTIARLRSLRSDLIDPAISVHHGRVVKRTGDGILIEFRSVVDAVRCAIEVQNGMVERNAGLPPERQIQFRVGIHLGDVIEEADGDLMGDGVNIAARLENICEPGAVCLSEQAYWQVKSRLDLAVTDLGDKELKNIPEPVHVFSLEVGKAAQTKPAEPASQTSAASSAPPLSIVVLPFSNIGGDPEQEYFVDGVTESLTTDLSRIRNSFVIARNTAFTYKGTPIDAKQIGRDLNVRYVLEGSVQRAGNHIRVNVQLINTESGAHLWAERFDRDYGDLFEMQDEIVARLASSLNAQFIVAEARRAERAINPNAMDLYFRAQAIGNGGLNPSNFETAQALFREALALDPSNVDALIGYAFCLVVGVGGGMSGNSSALLTMAEDAAKKANVLAPNYALAHAALAYVYCLTGRPETAIAEGEQALSLDPNQEFAYGSLAFGKLRSGRPAEVEAHVKAGLRLNPKGNIAWGWYIFLGIAKAYLGENEEAATWFRRSIELNRTYPATYLNLAAMLANLGRVEEAGLIAKQGLALNPDFNIARYRLIRGPAGTEDPIILARRERMIDGLRLAGVPEG